VRRVPEFLHVTMFTIDQTFTYAFEKKRPEEITNKVITFIKFGKVSMLYGCYISFSCTLGGFVCLFVFGGLEFELKASHLQSRRSTASSTPPVHFAVVILEMGSCKLFV
jgi:hypothetical protein